MSLYQQQNSQRARGCPPSLTPQRGRRSLCPVLYGLIEFLTFVILMASVTVLIVIFGAMTGAL